jgi:hypothetical protein
MSFVLILVFTVQFFWIAKVTKDQGGLGIQDLEVKNIALLGKWLFRLLTEDGVWQTLLR